MAPVRRQLAVYGLWAASRGVPIGNVRVQAVWLQDDPAWAPEMLELEDVKNVVSLIEEQDAFERSAKISQIARLASSRGFGGVEVFVVLA